MWWRENIFGLMNQGSRAISISKCFPLCWKYLKSGSFTYIIHISLSILKWGLMWCSCYWWLLGHLCACGNLVRFDCIRAVRNIASHWWCSPFSYCPCMWVCDVCVEIWQVLITLAGKKREVTLTKEKPRDRKLRNANSPSSIQSRGSQISKRANHPPSQTSNLEHAQGSLLKKWWKQEVFGYFPPERLEWGRSPFSQSNVKQ